MSLAIPFTPPGMARKPTESLRLNLGHPLARDLVIAWPGPYRGDPRHIRDLSPYHHDGDFGVSGGASATSDPMFGHGWSTNGTSDYLRYPASSTSTAQWGSNGLTVALWVRAQDDDAMWFSQRAATGDPTDHQLYGRTSATWQIWQNVDGNISIESGNNFYAAGDMLFLVGTWLSGANTGYFWNISAGTFYTESSVITFSNPTDDAYYLFGTDPDTGTEGSLGNYAKAEFYDVKVWTRKLSADEVYQLYSPATRWALYQQPSPKIWIDLGAVTAFTLAADGTSYAWTPQTAGLALGRKLGAGAGAYSWTPQTAGLVFGRSLVAETTAYSWTPQTAGLALGRVVGAGAAAYSWTPQTAGLTFDRVLSAGAAAYTWTPQDATLTHGGVGFTIVAESAAYSWTPQTAGVLLGRVVGAEAASYSWTGQTAGVAFGRSLTAETTAYAWTPQTAGLALGRMLAAGAASYTWTGQDATLRSGFTIAAETAAYIWTGQDVGFLQNRALSAEATAYTWTGQTAGLALGRRIAALSGSYAWTPQTAGLALGRVLAAAGTAYTWTGQDATLVYSGAFVLPSILEIVNTATVSVRTNASLVAVRINDPIP